MTGRGKTGWAGLLFLGALMSLVAACGGNPEVTVSETAHACGQVPITFLPIPSGDVMVGIYLATSEDAPRGSQPWRFIINADGSGRFSLDLPPGLYYASAFWWRDRCDSEVFRARAGEVVKVIYPQH